MGNKRVGFDLSDGNKSENSQKVKPLMRCSMTMFYSVSCFFHLVCFSSLSVESCIDGGRNRQERASISDTRRVEGLQPRYCTWLKVGNNTASAAGLDASPVSFTDHHFVSTDLLISPGEKVNTFWLQDGTSAGALRASGSGGKSKMLILVL